MILSLLLACAASPPPPPPAGASVTVTLAMSGGGLLLECSAQLISRDLIGQDGVDALISAQPCNETIRWEGLQAGDYTFVVQGTQVALQTDLFTLAEDQAHDLGTVTLEPGGELKVTVYRDEGDPGGLPVLINGSPYGTTDAEGFVRILGAPLGEAEVSVKDGTVAAQAVVTIADSAQEVSLELAPLPQRPVTGLRFQIADAGAEVIWIHHDGPAAGRLLVGDIITSVNEAPLAGLKASQAGPLLAGDTVGTVRRFVFLRDGVEKAAEIVPVGARDLMNSDDEEE